MKFNIVNILILFGIFQGFLLIFLINSARPSRANTFLSILLAAFSLNTLKMMLFDIGFFSEYPALFFFPFFFLAIGPALYFYARSLTGKPPLKNASTWLHFTPAILNTAYYTVCLIIFDTGLIHFHNEIYIPLEELFSLLSVGFYILFTLRELKNHRIWRRKFHPGKPAHTLSWLRNLLVVFLIGWGMWCIFFTLNMTTNYFSSANGSEAYYPIYIYMSVFIYWIGYSGYLKQEFWSIKPSHRTNRKFQLNGLEQARLNKILQSVKENRLFEKPDLRIDDLATHFHMKATEISNLLNQGLQKNFHDVINEMRIAAFKARLRDPSQNHFTIQSLAEASGFKSRSTFNALFQKFVGMTPKAYKTTRQQETLD